MENQEIYLKLGAVEGKMDLVVSSIAALKESFDQMEKGRLSRLEVAFATLDTEVGTKAKNSAMWYSASMSVLGSVVSGVILYLLLHH